MEKRRKYSLLSIVFNLTPGLSHTAWFTKANSTQLRSSAISNGSAQKFSPDPVIDHFRAPARMVGLKSTGETNHYFDRAVSMMANSMRDPFLLPAWMTSIELIKAYINDIPGATRDPGSDVYRSWKVRAQGVSTHE